MYRSHLKAVKKILWVGYLAIALVFFQGLRLHVHAYNHDPATSDHTHKMQAHLGYEVSDTGYPDELTEIDLSQNGVLKNLFSGTLIIALFMAAIMFLSRRRSTQISWRPGRLVAFIARPFSLRPPLRAPPL